ncbi:sugar ABC transporter permease [Kineothrix sedimenti]|uniref:Sugar ABC transporter permease n=1 Tax=Kineothrix sedimenti TaxID=3123317 RepID=A0ABZ3EX50_9FIRM
MNKKKKSRLQYQRSAYLFILPSMLILTVFVFVPLGASLIISLLNMNIFMNDISFAGMKNFVRLFKDSRVNSATFNSLYFALFEVPLQIGLALLFSLFVAKNNRYTRALRTIYYLPFVCSMTAIGIVWSMLLDPNMGLVPYLLRLTGAGSVSFLKDPALAMPTIIAVSAWKGFGYTLTLITAAVLNVSASLYEAAEIDGANLFRKFIHITIPGIWPTVSFCIVTTMISALQMFDQAYVMTQGGPLNKTETVVQYIYDRGFQTAPYDLGYASAISVYLFIIIAVITFVLRRFVLERGGE